MKSNPLNILASFLFLFVLLHGQTSALARNPFGTQVILQGAYTGVMVAGGSFNDLSGANSVGFFQFTVFDNGVFNGDTVVFREGRLDGGVFNGVSDPLEGALSGFILLTEASFLFPLDTFATGILEMVVTQDRTSFFSPFLRLEGKGVIDFMADGGRVEYAIRGVRQTQEILDVDDPFEDL